MIAATMRAAFALNMADSLVTREAALIHSA
jgi:hypothetical protein